MSKLYSQLKKMVYIAVYPIYNHWKPKQTNIKTLLSNTFTHETKLKFIQVGSNDGKQVDPLFKYISESNWEGILIEPVPYIFEKLKENYKPYNKNLTFLNVAIDRENGQRPMYRFKNDESLRTYVSNYDLLNSFNKNHLLRFANRVKNIESFIVEDIIPTMNMKDVIVKYNFEKLDLLHLDTEGHDYEILKSFPFKKVKPIFLLFEHRDLSRGDFKKCCTLLRKQGYKLYMDSGDVFGIRS